MKKVDITEKLNFDDNPVLVVGDLEVEVNADAETVLRVLGAMENENQVAAITETLTLLFGEENFQKITSLKDKKGRKLSASSLMEISQAAIGLVLGEGDGGEQ